MTSQLGYQRIVTSLWPNISGSNSNQIMNLGQLIGFYMRKIFPKKSYTECGGETSLRPFSEKLKLSISLDQ